MDALHDLFGKVRVHLDGCTCADFQTLIDDPAPALLYLDPPYYVKGNDLYQEGFTEGDHQRLAALLKGTKHSWVLSYDDCPEVRALYDWAKFESIDVKYSITATKSEEGRSSLTKPELLIWN